MEEVDEAHASDFGTSETITWCPGCPNYGILAAVKQALANLVNDKKIVLSNVVIVSGVGCHDKMFDYVNVSGFHALHGRVLPTLLGIKLANPELTVIGFEGDGATYAEGISHFVHAFRYNADATFIVHDNQVFSLTTGQATPTSEKEFKSPTTPFGVKEVPLNPLALALVSGATFVARGFALDVPHLTKLIEEGVEHKGFAFIDVLQPCIVYHDTRDYFKKHVYKLEEQLGKHDASNYVQALRKAMEWDYCLDETARVPIGVFYKVRKPTFEEQWPQLKQLGKPFYAVERKIGWRKAIEEFKE